MLLDTEQQGHSVSNKIVIYISDMFAYSPEERRNQNIVLSFLSFQVVEIRHSEIT